MIAIREASIADIDGIARVHVQGWRESYKDLLSAETLAGLSIEERKAMWTEAFRVRSAADAFLVAEASDGEIVGFARGGPARAKGSEPLGADAELYAIYLLDTVKRQGIGRNLMAELFRRLAAHGLGSVGLWVLKDNKAARRFYESLGGVAGVEQSLVMRGETVTEIAYRFTLTSNAG